MNDLKNRKMKRLFIDDVKTGDYIYIISKGKYVKIVKIEDAYNSIDENGEYSTRWHDGSPDVSMKNLYEYLESWLHTWYGEIKFLRAI